MFRKVKWGITTQVSFSSFSQPESVSFLKEEVKICLGEAPFIYMIGLLHPSNRLGSTLTPTKQSHNFLKQFTLQQDRRSRRTTSRVATGIRTSRIVKVTWPGTSTFKSSKLPKRKMISSRGAYSWANFLQAAQVF